MWGDVFCFKDAVRKSLMIDYNEDISIEKMKEMVMYEFMRDSIIILNSTKGSFYINDV